MEEKAELNRELIVRGLRLMAQHFALTHPLQTKFNVRGWPNMRATTSEALSQVATAAAEALSPHGKGVVEQDHGPARDHAQATGGSCEDGPLGRYITLSETCGEFNAVVSPELPTEGCYWTLIGFGLDDDQDRQGRIIADAINRGLSSHDEQAAKGVVPGGSQDRPTEGGEAVTSEFFRWSGKDLQAALRQAVALLHQSEEYPGWDEDDYNLRAELAGIVVHADANGLAASPATPSGEIAGLREALNEAALNLDACADRLARLKSTREVASIAKEWAARAKAAALSQSPAGEG